MRRVDIFISYLSKKHVLFNTFGEGISESQTGRSFLLLLIVLSLVESISLVEDDEQ